MPKPKIICYYCKYWQKGKTVRTNIEWDKTRKNKKVRLDLSAACECTVTKKTTISNDESCRYFKPIDFFYCRNNDQRIAFKVCLNRSRKKNKEKKQYLECFNCRQQELEIIPICEKFEIKLPPRKIKRRKSKHRIIKRRDQNHRTIKRRSQKRIIKRRG